MKEIAEKWKKYLRTLLEQDTKKKRKDTYPDAAAEWDSVDNWDIIKKSDPSYVPPSVPQIKPEDIKRIRAAASRAEQEEEADDNVSPLPGPVPGYEPEPETKSKITNPNTQKRKTKTGRRRRSKYIKLRTTRTKASNQSPRTKAAPSMDSQISSAISAEPSFSKQSSPRVDISNIKEPKSGSVARHTIAAVGDSITAGCCGSGPTYIELLEGFKSARGGYSSQMLITRGYVSRAIKKGPKYLIVFMGINNPMQGNKHGACHGSKRWAGDLKSDLQSVYQEAKSADIKVIGVTIPYPKIIWDRKFKNDKGCLKKRKAAAASYDRAKAGGISKSRWISKKTGYCCKAKNSGRNPEEMWKKMSSVNDWIRSNADIVIDTADVYNEAEGMPRSLAGDGIHPGPKFHKWLASEVLAEVKKRESDQN